MITWDIQMYLLLIGSSVILVWYVQFLWNRRKLYIYSWKVPGPFSLPIIGAGYLYLGSPSDIMDVIVKLHSKYTGLFKIWLGPSLVFAIQEPEHIEKILTKCIEKADVYKFMSKSIGTGLMTAPASKWKKHRKIISPSFNQRILDSFDEIYAEQTIIFMEQLMKYIGEKDFDLLLLASNCAVDIFCEASMGIKMNIQTTDSAFQKNLERAMDITTQRMFKIWLQSDFVFKLHPLCKELNKCNEQARKVIIPVIKRKIEEYERKKAEKSSLMAETEEGTKKRLAFLDLMIENSNFTEEELREEVEIFLIAASDTTAVALCHLFIVLGLYQDVQQKVYEEAVEVLGEDRIADHSDLRNLKYTERVIKETLRLMPPVPIILRMIDTDVDLGEAILPAGSTAYFNMIFIHRSPKYWSEPLKFDPDRFLPEEIAKRHPGTYIPFSMGPRNCIGAPYGMMSLKIILATVIKKFKISTECKSIEELQFNTSIVVRLRKVPKVFLELR